MEDGEGVTNDGWQFRNLPNGGQKMTLHFEGEEISFLISPRSESCILDLTSEGTFACCLCHHGQIWHKGADYGHEEHDACESCCQGTCEVIARFN